MLEFVGTPTDVLLYSGTDAFFRDNGTGLACPCCGSELTITDVSSRSCAICGDMVSIEKLLGQIDGLVANWKLSA